MPEMTEWNAIVEWDHAAEPDPDWLDELVERLLAYAPSIGIRRPAGRVSMSATITVQAATLRTATRTALRAVEAATGQRATGIEVLTTAEFDRRLEATA